MFYRLPQAVVSAPWCSLITCTHKHSISKSLKNKMLRLVVHFFFLFRQNFLKIISFIPSSSPTLPNTKNKKFLLFLTFAVLLIPALFLHLPSDVSSMCAGPWFLMECLYKVFSHLSSLGLPLWKGKRV